MKRAMVVGAVLLLVGGMPRGAAAGGWGDAAMGVVKYGSYVAKPVFGAYDAAHGRDRSGEAAIVGTGAGLGICAATTGMAVAAGAGPLAGYAGVAAAVSHLGLGGATTAIASMMGSSATGAAATAVVTSAVGGPVVMVGLVAGAAGGALYAGYKVGHWAWRAIFE